ncbi:MAG: hypothetical protein HYV26_02430 [Candidatus Hydrogenedentes bacterium]|nr:hypothetical protein [Candidatus Hydrogenedentota bacterium]
MKHLTRISKQGPAQAATWQDSVCLVVTMLAEVLGFLGGESPILLYLDDKCTIPQPNDTGQG